ncbi:LOW QUALITY PROTEIN: UDP-glycosyltransferase 82A1 [Primulina tabacum]|uniref:LOW QUALITY PROTEIN: UDP-glycosyltransferase 82A1 n=1 Tax=Primulina tabacum TaxID=48773 RepID=UPI003F59FEBF
MTVMLKKVILIPYPAQGHVNPMIKLASLLSSMGFNPIIITPEFIHRRVSHRINDGIVFMSIPDGLREGTPRDFFSIEMAMEKNMASPLEELVRKMIMDGGEENDGGGIGFFVVDLLASWAIDVGRRCRVAVAGFWPAMHATYRVVAAIPDLIHAGVISEDGIPEKENAPICLSPNDPTISTSDLPWLIGSATSRSSRFKFWTRTLDRSNTLPWILTNTFPNESQSKTTQQATFFENFKTSQVLEIGSLIMQSSAMASFWEEDMSCLRWLNEQDKGSVVYVSFGSWVSPIGKAKTRSLALALESCQRPFLWVLGSEWREGLSEGYVERIQTRGRIMSWAPQVEVLRHNAVGCYVTHCGWNSTMESLQCMKPLLCYPIAGDQFLNCAYIVNVWRIGVKLEGFGREEIENVISTVLEDEQMRWRIEKLNDKLFGKEGISKARAKLMAFIQDI